MSAIDKRLKSLEKALEAQGWRIDPIKKGFMAYPPDRNVQPVTVHKTPSDHRAWKNLLSILKRSGFDASDMKL